MFDYLIRCASGEPGDWARLAAEDVRLAGERGNKISAELAEFEKAIDDDSLCVAIASFSALLAVPIDGTVEEVKAHNDVVEAKRRFEALLEHLRPAPFAVVVEAMTEPPGTELET